MAVAVPVCMATITHPRLIRVEQLEARDAQSGWVRSDTWFVMLMLAAVVFCALVPFVFV